MQVGDSIGGDPNWTWLAPPDADADAKWQAYVSTIPGGHQMPTASADEMARKRQNILARFPRGSVTPETVDVLLERCRGHAGNVVSTLQKQGYTVLFESPSRPSSTPQIVRHQRILKHPARSAVALM